MTDQLREFVENNPKLVTRRESTRYPGLFVIKYTRKVFYDALWNDVLEECRGLVVDKDWNRVVNPFKKIYNRGERGTDFPLDTRVVAVKKINGFMAAATVVPTHGVVISTTGSLDSPYVALAEQHLRGRISRWIDVFGHGMTWLFEICDPRDPHIIPEEPGAYLIGARRVGGTLMLDEARLDRDACDMGALRPQVWYGSIRFSTLLDLAKACQHEGYVVHGPNNQSLKIKSPYYLVTKFLSRMRNDKFLERINDPKLKETVDEEYYPLLDYLKNTQSAFNQFDEQGKLAYIRNFLENR